MSRSLVLLPLAALLSACVLTAEPPPPYANQPIAGAKMLSLTGQIPAPGGKHPPRVAFEDIEGAEPARVRAALTPAERALSRCVPNSGGIVRLRIQRRGDQVVYLIASSVAIDPAGRRCVLEALSPIYVDDIGTTRGN